MGSMSLSFFLIWDFQLSTLVHNFIELKQHVLLHEHSFMHPSYLADYQYAQLYCLPHSFIYSVSSFHPQLPMTGSLQMVSDCNFIHSTKVLSQTISVGTVTHSLIHLPSSSMSVQFIWLMMKIIRISRTMTVSINWCHHPETPSTLGQNCHASLNLLQLCDPEYNYFSQLSVLELTLTPFIQNRACY